MTNTLPEIHTDIHSYNAKQSAEDQKICNFLASEITKQLTRATNKLWHAHPVWFLDGNPIVGYSKQKLGIRLMFWSGVDFGEENLTPGTGKFKDASFFYTQLSQIHIGDLKRWLAKATVIQWDYKNIVKRKGKLVRIEVD